MAQMIGRTKSWIWWIGGIFCALIWGMDARGGTRIGPIQPPYGVRPIKPVGPPKDTLENVKKAEKLANDYGEPVKATKPDAGAAKEIGRLILEFGAKSSATRNAAGRDVVTKFGTAALTALRKAAGDKDLEVVQRSRQAIRTIEDNARKPLAIELQKLGSAGKTAVLASHLAAGRESGRLSQEIERLRKLQAEGKAKASEVDAAKLKLKVARERAALLGRLRSRLYPVARPTCYSPPPLPPGKRQPKKKGAALERRRRALVDAMESEGRLRQSVAEKLRRGMEREVL